MISNNKSRCNCAELRSTIHSQLAENAPGRNRSLLAFLKEDDNSMPINQQLDLINEFCQIHGLKLARKIVFQDTRATSLQEAIRQMAFTDGLIVSDLDRLVSHECDRGHDLRTLLHEFVGAPAHKRLVSVSEGIDTRTPSGQQAAMEMINQIKDSGSHEDWVPNTSRA